MTAFGSGMEEIFASIENGSAIFDTQRLGDSWVLSPRAGQETAFDRLVSDLTFGHLSTVVVLPVSDERGAFVRAVIMGSDVQV